MVSYASLARRNPIARQLERFIREPLSVRNAASVIVIATAAVVVGAGVLISLIDGQEYPNVGLGMWFALQTVTTVGYGDITPTNVAGKLVAAAIMLQGTAFIAIVTAVITSAFVARATREHHEERAQEGVDDRELIEQRFDALEEKLDALASIVRPPGPGAPTASR